MNPRIAFIGVRSSWLTLARKRDFASLARASEAFVSSSRAARARCSSNSVGQALAGPVEVRASCPNSSRFGTSTRWLRSPAVIPARARAHLADGQDERPRQDEPEQKSDDDAHHGEDDHGAREQVAVGVEGRLGLVDLLVGRRRSGCGATPRARARSGAPRRGGACSRRRGRRRRRAPATCSLAGGVGRRWPSAGRGGAGRRPGRPRPSASSSVGERRLGVGDLGVVLVVVGQQRHRPVVALGGDRVEHLLGPARLLPGGGRGPAPARSSAR